MAIAFESITGQVIRLILLGTMALIGGFILAPLTLKFLIKIKAGKQLETMGTPPCLLICISIRLGHRLWGV